MIRRSEMLADATRKLLHDRRLSRRQAEGLCNVSYSIIDQMAKGRVPGADHILRFAHAFNQDVTQWLEMCEYSDIAQIIREERGVQNSGQLDALLEPVPELTRSKARDAARQAIQTLIVPVYTELAA